MDLIKTALGEYGTMEIAGDKSNPEINKYFDLIGQEWADDSVSWCSAFINWVAKVNGYEYSGKLNARSWLDVGEVVLDFNLDDPIVAILWRESPDSWKGHVALPIRKNTNNIWLLGGNQNNMVRISAYPIDRVLGYRKLRKL